MITAEAYIMPLGDVVVKALGEEGGKRIVEVQCSSEAVDQEGDVVLQRALLDSADSFVRSGHLDIDHLSEIGSRIGIRDPDSYIIGRPTEVKDLGNKRTGLVGEIMRSKDGLFSTEKNRFDAFWKSLQSEPSVKWSASIYGFPTDLEDCTEKACSSGATRYVIKALDWRSTAFTRNPINNSLTGYAKVVAAKAMVERMRIGIQKDSILPFGLGASDTATSAPSSCALPWSMDHAWGQYQRHKSDCPFMHDGNSVLAFQNHYMACCGASFDMAEVMAHALMYAILKDRKRSSS